MSTMRVRALKPEDLEMLARHKVRHMEENGQDDDVIFAPAETVYTPTEDDLKREALALAKKPTEPGWMRLWIITDEKEIYGDLTLVHRPSLPTALHRCLVMMGIQRPARRQGFGSQLIKTALEWVKEQPTLDWVSLNVFENNPNAKALYRKFGFEPDGTTKDLFRVRGQSIDDTQMVLRIKRD